jgi:BirA family biotin operon repressor/biotin-[acetyl-CoA-carboxylase] ligase
MEFPFLQTLVESAVLDSTSDTARRLLEAGAVELPLAVWADRQTQGRGRGSNRWWSDAGSLTFTLAIDPAAYGLRPEHEPRLALATAVAVIGALGPLRLAQSLGIRWPNDIEVNEKKLGGILPERLETLRGPRLMIGIGLNVATRLADAPPEVRDMATSLDDLRGTPGAAAAAVDAERVRGEKERLFSSSLREFEVILGRLAANDPRLAAEWAALDTLRERAVRVDLGTRTVAGTGRGIDAEGALCLAAEEGVVRLFGGRVLRDP